MVNYSLIACVCVQHPTTRKKKRAGKREKKGVAAEEMHSNENASPRGKRN